MIIIAKVNKSFRLEPVTLKHLHTIAEFYEKLQPNDLRKLSMNEIVEFLAREEYNRLNSNDFIVAK